MRPFQPESQPPSIGALRSVSWIGGVIPGWFLLVADPLFRRLGGRPSVVSARLGGVDVDLDLADYLQRKLYLRSFERRELRFLGRWLAPGDVAVDVGANVGVLSLTMASAVGPGGTVVAIEPLGSNVATLRRWCDRNGMDWVEVIEGAASDEAGTLTLGVPELGVESASTGHYSASHTGAAVTVASVTLDEELPARIGSAGVRLLKIDVEGMEPAVLAGAEALLRSGAVAAVMLEVTRDSADPEEAADMLRSHGYVVRRIGIGGRLGGVAPRRRPRKPGRRGFLARNVVAIAPAR